MPHGYVSEGMAKQIGNFIGSFLEYDGKVLSLGYSGTMRVRVKVDVRITLKRKKKIAFLNGSLTYVTFAYEKLTQFCFLYDKLGHGESFCPSQILQVNQNLSLGWDIFLCALSRRGMVSTSKLLREEGAVTTINDQR